MERSTMKPPPAASSSGLPPIANRQSPTPLSLLSYHSFQRQNPESQQENSSPDYKKTAFPLAGTPLYSHSSLSPPPPCVPLLQLLSPSAFDWLKEQKKKSSKFVLAPIDASRVRLRSAYRLLSATKSDNDYTKKELEEVQSLVRSAARDCVQQERNSFVAFQANTGVECVQVCTFQLIVKNAFPLLDKKDPVKLEAEAKLNDLIRSFTSLNGLANEIDIQLASNRPMVADALMDAISSLNKFEQGVKDCLDV